jgi:hypothetical protein
MMPGQVEAQFKKCGRGGCKCSRGELHGPYFYHRTWGGDRHQRRYVRLADVPEARAACEAYRALQTRIRLGRLEYQHLMRRVRALLAGG